MSQILISHVYEYKNDMHYFVVIHSDELLYLQILLLDNNIPQSQLVVLVFHLLLF